MIRTLSLALALTFLAAPAFAADAPKETVTLKSAKAGDVKFNHETHKDQKCTVCHATEAGGKIEGLDQKKAHALCQDCHKKDAAKKAPVKCDGCQVGS